MARPKFWMIGGAALALGLAAVSPQAGHAQTQMAATMLTQTTASYTVELDVGPAAQMLSLDQAAMMGMGEVMVSMPDMGMSMPSGSMSGMSAGSSMSMTGSEAMGAMPMMATTDNGQPVNHHLEVHVLDSATGAPDASVDPQIQITNESTGQSRMVDDVAAMYDVQVGMGDLHYGNNVYLPDGTYTVTVMIGQETATFQHVAIANGMGLSMAGMGNSMSGTMPDSPMMPGH
jgi:5-hydroxyisourate hydrolase-like protein (transthyretin family)